jgi:endonuclease/exonuclease/phosphatase family metal-dependent hydrolase
MNRRLIPVCLLFLLITTACHVPRPIRVMSYNIHHAEGMDGKIDLLRIAEVIRREAPDIVALQEVDRNVLRTGGRDLLEELAVLLNMHHAFGKNISFQGGAYGNAVLSRFPIISKENHPLPNVGAGEQRGLLEVVIQAGEQELVVMNTHLDHRPDDAARLLSVPVILNRVRSAGGRPVLLCGDFNTRPGGPVYEQLTKELTDAWLEVGEGFGYTISSARPYERIDFIFLSKNLKPLKAWIPLTQASDHFPVVVEFRK